MKFSNDVLTSRQSDDVNVSCRGNRMRCECNRENVGGTARFSFVWWVMSVAPRKGFLAAPQLLAAVYGPHLAR